MSKIVTHLTMPGDVEREIVDKKGREDTKEINRCLKSGQKADAAYHLGFYLDENGDLCQVDEGE